MAAKKKPAKKKATEKPAPGKRGRKPVLGASAVAEALAESAGNVSAVARKFGVHRSSVQGLIDRDPALQGALADARERLVDEAESSLLAAVLAGEAWAVCFTLKTQGKRRGYAERVEVTGKDGGPIEFVEVVRVAGPDAAGAGAGEP